jgi:hypothetical protein
MGCYIQTGRNTHKAAHLIAVGARFINKPDAFEVPEGKVLICVVENGLFDAAAVIFDEREFTDFSVNDHTGRARTWLLMDKSAVLAIAPYAADFLK